MSKDVETWYNKGNALSDLGKHTDAIVCYDKVIELDPKNIKAWNNKGVALSNLGKHTDAIVCYDKVIELDPKNIKALYNKGNALSNLGKHTDAIVCYDKVIELDPKDILAWYNKGNALSKLGKHTDAIECYNKAIELDPKYLPAWGNKGNTLSNLGKHTDAIECYNKAIELDPKHILAWGNKGNTFYDLGKHTDAIVCYDKVIELDQKNTAAWSNKGLALYDLGKHADAIECYGEALRIVPDSLFRLNRGELYYLLKKTKEALKDFEKIDDENLNDQKYNNIGLCYMRILPLKKKAEKQFLQAIESNPDLTESYYNLGVLYNDTNRPDAAKKLFELCLSIDRRFTKAIEALSKLEDSSQSDWFDWWFVNNNSKKWLGSALIVGIASCMSFMVYLINKSSLSEFDLGGLLFIMGLLSGFLLLPSLKKFKLGGVELSTAEVSPTKIKLEPILANLESSRFEQDFQEINSQKYESNSSTKRYKPKSKRISSFGKL